MLLLLKGFVVVSETSQVPYSILVHFCVAVG